MKRQLMKVFSALILAVALLAPCVSMADCCCRKIVDYTVVSEGNFHSLDVKVKQLMKEGWQPLGGVSDAYMRKMAQAMVKYEEVEE